jgi:hypothetical protein
MGLVLSELAVVLIPVAWLALTTLILATCQMAARADAASRR